MSTYAEKKASDEKLATYHLGRLYLEMWRAHASYETATIRVETNDYPSKRMLNELEEAGKKFVSARDEFRRQLEGALYYEDRAFSARTPIGQEHAS